MEEIHMNNVKKIAILLLVVAVMTGFTQAASHHHSGPDATLRLSGGSFALGIGFRWGSGTLSLQGQRLSGQGERTLVGKVGVTGSFRDWRGFST
jgi:hypothetical protein